MSEQVLIETGKDIFYEACWHTCIYMQHACIHIHTIYMYKYTYYTCNTKIYIYILCVYACSRSSCVDRI